MPRLLELFSGTGILSRTALARGWETRTVDRDPHCKADIVATISHESLSGIREFAPDMVWASPPCETFSVASIGKHWGGGYRAYVPMTDQARDALRLIGELARIIVEIDPAVWFIENPRGVMRKVEKFHEIHTENTPIVFRHTITYCQYGEERMKPTDIWTNCYFWTPRPACRNGDLCHTRAPRGAKTGTQGRKTYLDRSALPLELCTEVLSAAEKKIEENHPLSG